jgi:hypothetical protein
MKSYAFKVGKIAIVLATGWFGDWLWYFDELNVYSTAWLFVGIRDNGEIKALQVSLGPLCIAIGWEV